MTLPNFLLVGAARSGSTYLYRALKQHPDVFLPERKELQYFSNHIAEGGAVDLNEYCRYFEDVGDQRCIGEMSPDYMYPDWVAETLAKNLPNTKLLFILRNPIDRAYSHYWHNIRKSYDNIRNRKETLTFEQALDQEAERLEKGSHNDKLFYSYVDRGFYLRQIEPFKAHFPRKQMKFIIFDDLQNMPDQVLGEVCAFLGIEPFKPLQEPDKHHAVIPKYAGLHRTLTKLRIAALDAPAPISAAGRALKQMQASLPKTNDHPPMKSATRARLRDIYRDANAQLLNWLSNTTVMWD